MHAQRRLGEQVLRHLEQGELEAAVELVAEMLTGADHADLQSGRELAPDGVWSCVLADQHSALLQSLPELVGDWGFDVLATTGTGRAALQAIARHRPDVALVDGHFPDLGGVELTRRALEASPDTAVAVYHSGRDRLLASELIRAGARALVYKDAPLSELRRALETVAAGGTYVDPVAGAALLAEPGLTTREREVLRLLADGLTREEIAERLGIGEGTVRAHLVKANRRLGARNRTHAVAVALRKGLI